MNAKEAVPMRITLEELNHPQPATPIRRTDYSTADGIMNRTVKQKQSKSMNMQFYWLQDRVKQGQFRVLWAPGKINLADYQSKVQTNKCTPSSTTNLSICRRQKSCCTARV